VKGLIAILVLFPALAWAQSSAAPADSTTPTTVQASTVFGSPCPYPQGPLRAGVQGRTVLAYWTAPDKRIVKVSLLASSGNPELDQAAIDCVGHWTAMHAGWTTSVTMGGIMDWTLSSAGSGSSGAMAQGTWGEPHACAGWYPQKEQVARISGLIRVQFVVTTTGAVRDPHVLLSSGNADLDEAALACVQTWHYRPKVQDGAAVEVPWQADVRFQSDVVR
jgi:TonB family protein